MKNSNHFSIRKLIGFVFISFIGVGSFFIFICCASNQKSNSDNNSKDKISFLNSRQMCSGVNETMEMKKLAKDNYFPEYPSNPKFINPIGGDYEKYRNYGENVRTSPWVEPFSTFSIDVDSGSYSNARRFLFKQGKLPNPDSIRVEEFLNYFDYDYPQPKDKPFSLITEMASSPFDSGRYILRVGIQGKQIAAKDRPPVNLVFLLDVSGSMNSESKLGLLKSSMKLLSNQLTKKDRISIVVYAGAAGVVLDSAEGDNLPRLKKALRSLTAGGSTAGGEGLLLAYKLAKKNFIDGGINRIILGTDGDFNVGITSHEELISMIETKRAEGVSLTVLGFGAMNYNDLTMEQLADKGNGNYFYIDTLNEARKVLVEELSATLETIASDVKIQIEFNPLLVKSWRLIGYENRKLEKEDFDNDKIDAGEIGAGHDVTALYEITLVGSQSDGDSRYKADRDKLKKLVESASSRYGDEIAFFRLRYKMPGDSKSQLIEKSLLKKELQKSEGSEDFLFAIAVAQFGQILRKGEYVKANDYQVLISFLEKIVKKDPFGYRREMLQMVKLADELKDENKWLGEGDERLLEKY